MWFSLIRIASNRPMRWFVAPPQRTAYFCARRNPGTVLRVSRIVARVPRTASAYCAAMVAVPDNVCRKFSAQRSAPTSVRALPRSSHTMPSASMRAPSSTRQSITVCASSSRKHAPNHGRPHTTAASRAITRARACACGGNRSAVTSPLPKSSASARRTSASTVAESGGCGIVSRIISASGCFRPGVCCLQALDDRVEGAVEQGHFFQNRRVATADFDGQCLHGLVRHLQALAVDEQVLGTDRTDPRQLRTFLGRAVDTGEFDPGADFHRLDLAQALVVLAQFRSEEHTSELQSPVHLVCRLLLEK